MTQPRRGVQRPKLRKKDGDAMRPLWKGLAAMVVGFVLSMATHPAAAYVVAVTTSIPAQSVASDDDLDAALKSAIDERIEGSHVRG